MPFIMPQKGEKNLIGNCHSLCDFGGINMHSYSQFLCHFIINSLPGLSACLGKAAHESMLGKHS